jgi:uncharacterized protein (TIGR02284 family)
MTTSNEAAISELNELIETCKDGQQGFAHASEETKDSELKTLFTHYAAQRAKFAEELQKEVKALGGTPEKRGSAAGAVHRGWIDVKAAITGKDDHAILEECERGEDVAKEAYEKAADGNQLPGTLLPLIQQQYANVKEAHDRIRDLRDSIPAGRR